MCDVSRVLPPPRLPLFLSHTPYSEFSHPLSFGVGGCMPMTPRFTCIQTLYHHYYFPLLFASIYLFIMGNKKIYRKSPQTRRQHLNNIKNKRSQTPETSPHTPPPPPPHLHTNTPTPALSLTRGSSTSLVTSVGQWR